MANSYVKEDDRKHKYSTRSQIYLIQRITDPSDYVDQEYNSARTMCKTLQISERTVKDFMNSDLESRYIRSKKTGILYLLKKPIKEIVLTARCIEYDNEEPDIQTFTSEYQLLKRFSMSYSTISEIKKMQPIGQECTKPVYDEFGRKYLVTFLR